MSAFFCISIIGYRRQKCTKNDVLIGRQSCYTRSTLPDFKALAETQTRLGFPLTRIRTF